MMQKRQTEDKSESVMKAKIKRRLFKCSVALFVGFISAGIVYVTLTAFTGKDFEILNLLAIFAGSFTAFFVLTVLGYRQLRQV